MHLSIIDVFIRGCRKHVGLLAEGQTRLHGKLRGRGILEAPHFASLKVKLGNLVE